MYDWLKAVHVLAVISWMAGMLYLPRLMVYHVDAAPGSVQSETFKVMERRLLRGIINPASIATALFGVLLIAIDSHGRLQGSKTLKQDETPGLGGRIAEQPNAWLQGFSGKSRTSPDDAAWALKKDNGQFDQIAGATITSRAVISALHDALRYFDEHRQQLLSGAADE